MNRLELDASIAQRDVTRYTPSGMPIVNCTLAHQSEVVEGGMSRQVDMTLPALAAGEISGRIERLELGQAARFIGFLAHRSRNARSLIFHITELQDIAKD